MRVVSILLVAALSLAGAGCFSKNETPAQRQFSASGGKVSEGWAYDGAGVASGSATLAGTLSNPDNAGSVNVSFSHHGSKYVVTFDRFSGAEEFKDGGVRFDFDEHGDTKNGDASLPRMHVKAAAWGVAQVTRDGEALKGKTSPDWSAHLMLSDDTVRGADGKVLNAAGSAPYSPGAPTDAKVTMGDPQAMFYIKSPDGETARRGPLNESKTLTFQGPEGTQKVDIPAEKGAETLVVNVTFSGGQAPVGVGQAKVRLKDAAGNATKSQDLNILPNQPATIAWDIPAAEITGPFALEIVGQGAFTAKVDYAVTFDDHPFIVVTWDEVALS